MSNNELFDINQLPLDFTTKFEFTWLLGTNDKNFFRPIFKPTPFACYDQFVTNGLEYLFLSCFTAHLPETERILIENGFIINNINGKNRISKDEKRGIFFAYRETQLPNTYKEKHELVACLYFMQNTNEQLETFFDHYTNQGVEKIFAFYNGNLAEKIDYLPKRNNVEYFEWNYMHKRLLKNDKTGVKYTQQHAQSPLYNIFLKKISPYCKWSLFFDCDEFIAEKNFKISLKDYLLRNNINRSVVVHSINCIFDSKNKIITYDKINLERTNKKVIVATNDIEPHDRTYVHFLSKKRNRDENLILWHYKHFDDDYILKNMFNKSIINF